MSRAGVPRVAVTEAPCFVAVGHVTRDVAGDATMAGGAAFYAARTAAALGLRASVLTSLGDDFEHRAELRDVTLVECAAAESTRFVNRYEPGGRRQQVEALAAALTLRDAPAQLRQAAALYVCPVLGEVEPGIASAFDAKVVGAGAQGWMRSLGASGEVRRRRWRPTARELSSYDLIVLSDEDAAGDDEVVGHLRRRVPLLAYTHGEAGSELFHRGERHRVPALPTTQVGPTGAGDAYGAALVAGLLWGLEPVDAAYLASCVAAVVVEAVGGAALGRVGEVWGRLERYGELHRVDVSRVLASRPALPDEAPGSR
ncbi:MAG: hypothetical protein JRI23_35545 [Deltaproteobacteria bacterium]|nr:hypothetical protein [Deltaproteobacteria bacterium]MBW2537645.1 hypothetical protein [Deltaproteobacteria bacterium]